MVRIRLPRLPLRLKLCSKVAKEAGRKNRPPKRGMRSWARIAWRRRWKTSALSIAVNIFPIRSDCASGCWKRRIGNACLPIRLLQMLLYYLILTNFVFKHSYIIDSGRKMCGQMRGFLFVSFYKYRSDITSIDIEMVSWESFRESSSAVSTLFLWQKQHVSSVP